MRFELQIYDAEQNLAETRFEEARTTDAIKGRAGNIAKANDAPVDVAVAGDGSWDIRYITTAMPSEHHAKGYRFERIV